MATQIQTRRGSTAQTNAFTGALGEITVDTTLDIIVVHDGATAGGFPAVNTTSTQTLTNKTLTSPTLTTPTITGTTTFSDGAYNFDIASHDGTNGLQLGGVLVTASAAELNALDGITATVTELNYTDGVTSAIQTQLDAKLVAANNLSDLSDAGTARTNLGLGSLATLSAVGAAQITDNTVGAAELNVSGNGSAGQFLSSDGDGSFSWSTPAAGYADSDVNTYLTSTHAAAVRAASITKTGTNGVGDIGQSGNKFATIYGQSTSAQYADLAERYVTDHEYEPGTVVVFGGTAEVTESHAPHDRRVAGVISTNPAFKMNDDAEGQYLALQGRVPTKVKGPIDRGDLVVTSNLPGTAQKLDDAQYLPGVVIGKALESIEDDQVHTIEVVVGRL